MKIWNVTFVKTHLIECKEINKHKKEYEKPLEYEEILKANLQNELIIVRHFIENMKIRSKLKI